MTSIFRFQITVIMINGYHFGLVEVCDVQDSTEGWDDVDVDGSVWENCVLEGHILEMVNKYCTNKNFYKC